MSLRDGRRILVRPIGADDKALIAWGVAHLSRESSYLRFFSTRTKLSASELRYLTEVDHVDHEALVAVLADDPSVLVGVARFVRQTDDHEAAEVAVTIGDDFQGQGVGRELLALLMDSARERGIRRFVAIMLSENTGAHKLFGSAGKVVEVRRDGTEVRLVFDLGTVVQHPHAEVPELLAAA